MGEVWEGGGGEGGEGGRGVGQDVGGELVSGALFLLEFLGVVGVVDEGVVGSVPNLLLLLPMVPLANPLLLLLPNSELFSQNYCCLKKKKVKKKPRKCHCTLPYSSLLILTK